MARAATAGHDDSSSTRGSAGPLETGRNEYDKCMSYSVWGSDLKALFDVYDDGTIAIVVQKQGIQHIYEFDIKEQKRLEKLADARGRYIEYLGKAIDMTAVHLHTHGWQYDAAMLKYGEDLRNEIAALEKGSS